MPPLVGLRLGQSLPCGRGVVFRLWSSIKHRQVLRLREGHFRHVNTVSLQGLKGIRDVGLVSVRWKGASITRLGGLAVIGLGTGCYSVPRVHCDATPTAPETSPPEPSPPASSVSMLQLSFGTVAGLCAGVFIKKGAKAVAWVFGGVFVLLQYLRYKDFVTIHWGIIGSKFENLFYVTKPDGSKKPPTVGSLWYWLVDFLTTDFQWRATFVTGLAVGLKYS